MSRKGERDCALMSGKAFGPATRGRRFATCSRGPPGAFDALRFQQEIASVSRNMRVHAPVETACLRQDCVQREHTNGCRIAKVAEMGNFKFPAQQRQHGSMSNFKNNQHFRILDACVGGGAEGLQ